MCVCLHSLLSSAPSPLPQILGLRSSLELKMTNHQAMSIVFQLEHVFSAPIGRETMVRGMQKNTSDPCLKDPPLRDSSTNLTDLLILKFETQTDL